MGEIWRDIVGYEGLYQVSNLGNVKSINYRKTSQEKLMKLTPHKYGYLTVELRRGGKRKLCTIHRLVAQAFIENPSNKPCIDHINTIRTDNRACNLRWVTHKENSNNPLTKERFMKNQNGAKKVFCDGVIYVSITKCAEYYNVKKTTMNDWLTGRHSMPADFQAKGLRYYIEE